MKRIGVYADRDSVAIVVTEGEIVVWSGTVALQMPDKGDDNSTPSSALATLLKRLPVQPWWPSRVNIALGDTLARAKTVHGVPVIRRRKELLSLLRMNTTRFVASSKPVIITGAVLHETGATEIGIADRETVAALTKEVMSNGLRIGYIVPASVVESYVGRKPTSGEPEQPRTPESLAARAALVGSSNPLALQPRDNPAVELPDISRRRVGISASGLVLAMLLWFGNQLQAERSNLNSRNAAVHRIAAMADSGMRTETQLLQMNRDLAGVATFSRRRMSVGLLLGAITQALPKESVITTFRLDTANVDLVTLSPRTAAVVDALSEVPVLTAPTVIGPVSREMVGTRELERATIRLRLAPDIDYGKTVLKVEREEEQ